MTEMLIDASENDKPVFTGHYPITFKAINAQPKYSFAITRFEKIKPLIIEALENGEVVSSQMALIKSGMNDLIKYAFEGGILELYRIPGKWHDQAEDLRDLAYDYPDSARGIPGIIKKLAKIHPELKKRPMWIESAEIATELLELTKVDAWLKEHTVKASVKKVQIKEAKEAEEGIYQKKFTNNKDSIRVTNLLKKTAAKLEDKIYAATLENVVRIVDYWKSQVEETGKANYLQMFKGNDYVISVLRTVIDFIRPKPNDSYDETQQFVLKSDYMKILEPMAKRIADDITNHFVSKNSAKLSFIMYSKNNLDTVSIHGANVRAGAIECDVVCKFHDGSSFVANSQMVWATSVLGKNFYRYPTRFMNVYLPDGSRMSAPTEQKMDEVFALAK